MKPLIFRPFHRRRHPSRRTSRRGAAAVAAAMIMTGWIVVFSWIYEGMTASGTAAQRESLELALEHAITSCYALEGMYPPDLEYMKEHYGLVYDEELFYVDYQPVAANLRPAYYIIEVSQEGFFSQLTSVLTGIVSDASIGREGTVRIAYALTTSPAAPDGTACSVTAGRLEVSS